MANHFAPVETTGNDCSESAATNPIRIDNVLHRRVLRGFGPLATNNQRTPLAFLYKRFGRCPSRVGDNRFALLCQGAVDGLRNQ